MGVTGHVIRRFGKNTQMRFADFYDANEHPVLRRVLAACIEAAAAYKPQPLAHDACLFVADCGVFRASDPRTIWKRYVGALTVERVPGDHESVLRGTDCDGLAAAFSRQLAAGMHGEHAVIAGDDGPAQNPPAPRDLHHGQLPKVGRGGYEPQGRHYS
jgi:hypothetical protein